MELYQWQQPIALALREIMSRSPVGLNALPTGSGKTYINAWVAHELGLPTLVICPKSVISIWRTVMDGMGAQCLGVYNWESLKTGKHTFYKAGAWSLPPECLVLVDEVHKGASGPNTQTTRALGSLKAYRGVRVLGSSATIADSPLKMRALGYLLGLHCFNNSSYYSWCRANGCYTSPFHSGLEFPKGKTGAEFMRRIHDKIADRMVHLSLDDIPGFPESLLEAKLFDLDNEYTEETNKIYAEMASELKKPHSNPLVIQLRARQRTELLKVPLLLDLTNDALAEGKSVVLFVNFRETMHHLADELDKAGTPWVSICGEQLADERDASVRLFQDNAAPVCIAMTQAGGVGISLHDVKQERPRVSYINLNFSSSEMIQCLGRIHRANGTKVIQTFVLAANTIEERIHSVLSRKLVNIKALQDEDLML